MVRFFVVVVVDVFGVFFCSRFLISFFSSAFCLCAAEMITIHEAASVEPLAETT